MSCEHLICAQCSSPVSEARCPACQAARAQVHRRSPSFSLPLLAAALLALLLFTLWIQLGH